MAQDSLIQEDETPSVPRIDTPVLNEAQIGRIRPLGEERSVKKGDRLFTEGESQYDFMVILEGVAQIYEDKEAQRPIAEPFEANNFIGEMGLVTGESVFATCKMVEDGRVLFVSPDNLRELLGRDQELSGLLLRTFAERRSFVAAVDSGLTIIGSRSNPDAMRLATYGQRNYLPLRWIDLEDELDEAKAYLENSDRTLEDVQRAGAIAIWGHDTVLENPSNMQLAQAVGIGIEPAPDDEVDLAIIGAGPGGLAAAVYGASEGLRTVLIDSVGAGGQAGSSSRIEIYLGFPAGLSGAELANRAIVQARKFGAKFVMPHEVANLAHDDERHVYRLALRDGGEVCSKTVVIATGVQYRRLPIDRLPEFEGAGIFYATTEMEARLCVDETVAVVGGGNSAGQAAMYLSGRARKVLLLIRGDDIRKSMSSYLADRIDESDKIEVMLHSEVRDVHGEQTLKQIVIEHTDVGEHETVDCPALFLFIGAAPCTGWMETDGEQPTIALDKKGFIKTGYALAKDELNDPRWQEISPSTFETSLPGVFAVGDVRSGSTKRVAGAVGEGSVAVKAVHERIALYA